MNQTIYRNLLLLLMVGALLTWGCGNDPVDDDDAADDDDATDDDDTGDDDDTADDDDSGDDDVEDPAAGATVIGALSVDCDVPYVLDGSQIDDMLYMTSHFGDLIQEYGITGTVDGNDITAYPEKMYYGYHSPTEPVMILTQISMASLTSPTFSVQIEFDPDADVVTGAEWAVGTVEGDAFALVIEHASMDEMCLLGVGYGPPLTFSAATDVTLLEGGAFEVAGTFDVVDPTEVGDLCTEMAAQLPCC